MAEKLTVQVITVNGEEYQSEAGSCSFYSSSGHVGILPGHITSVIDISYTTVELIDENEVVFSKFFVTSGLASIRNNCVSFLCESFVQKDDLNLTDLNKELKICNEDYQKAKNNSDKYKLLQDKLILEEKVKVFEN